MATTASASPASNTLRAAWWTFLLRGLFGLALGVIALVQPGAALAALVLLVGIYFIVDGASATIKALTILKTDRSWWTLLLSGVVSIAAGLAVLLWPGLSLIYLVYMVAFWAIFTGALEIAAAIRLRAAIPNEWLYVVFGILSIVFGAFVLAAPGIGLIYLVTLIAIYGFVTGALMLGTAWRLRRLA